MNTLKTRADVFKETIEDRGVKETLQRLIAFLAHSVGYGLAMEAASKPVWLFTFRYTTPSLGFSYSEKHLARVRERHQTITDGLLELLLLDPMGRGRKEPFQIEMLSLKIIEGLAQLIFSFETDGERVTNRDHFDNHFYGFMREIDVLKLWEPLGALIQGLKELEKS